MVCNDSNRPGACGKHAHMAAAAQTILGASGSEGGDAAAAGRQACSLSEEEVSVAFDFFAQDQGSITPAGLGARLASFYPNLAPSELNMLMPEPKLTRAARLLAAARFHFPHCAAAQPPCPK